MSLQDSNAGALAGIKIVDLSRVLGGPFCTQVLGDHGANVIKIEPPSGDETRDWGPPFLDGLSSYFVGVNRNKRSLGLDLSKQDGREVLLKLLEDADVLIENFKPGTFERWGLEYKSVLRPRFPRLIYCQVTGFGATGPLGGMPGYDIAVQAMAGPISVNGSSVTGPMRVGIPLVDLGTGLNASIGILLALYSREMTGRGQAVEVSLYDSAVSLLHPHMANYLMSGRTPNLTGNSHPNICPCDLYPTRTKPVLIVAGNERQFAKLCQVLGCAGALEDPRFKSNKLRLQHRDAVNSMIADMLKGIDGVEIAAKLMNSGVVAGAFNDIAEVANHPHTRHTEMIVECNGYRGTGIPIKLQSTPGSVRELPPHFGESSEEILKEHGFSSIQIEGLTSRGVVCKQRAK